jgi:oligoendopeptidase F
MESMLYHHTISIDQLKEFLAAGTSDTPQTIFKNLGIDITKPEFRKEGLNEIQLYLQETITLAKDLGKL